MPHLVVDISGHGFGHAGQVIPVVRALMAARPDLRVTLRTAVPAATIRQHMDGEVAVDEPPADVGLVMHGPIDVDRDASAAAYAALHADFPRTVAREVERLAAAAPDIVLADVPYTSLAAARRIGVPAVALCSLTWLEAYRAYCGDRPEGERIAREIRDAYAAADVFLQVRPHTPMAELDNTLSLPPVCRVGRDRRTAVLDGLGLSPDSALVVAGFGGVPGPFRIDLPAIPGVAWLQAQRAPGVHGPVVDAGALALPFCDLAASADLVVTKSGYGTVCETLAAGTRLLTVGRPGWPEDPAMRAWLEAHGTTAWLDRWAATPDVVRRTVADLLARPRAKRVPPDGIAAARDRVLALLDAGRVRT
jgi:hypothetical protein